MSLVGFALELAGDVSSFTPSVLTEIRNAIAALAGVDPSAVTVTVVSGSLTADVRIDTPTAMATSVQSAMANATSSPSSATTMLASVTGVSIAVLAVVTAPIVAIIVPPPPPPPQRPPGAQDSAGGGAITILAIAVPAAIVGLLCCLAMVCWWTRRRQVKLRRADVNNWLRNMPVRRVSVNPPHQQEGLGRPSVCSVSIPSGSGGSGGNSPTFTTQSLNTSFNGRQLRVIVSNACHSVTSFPAVITISSSMGSMTKPGKVIASAREIMPWRPPLAAFLRDRHSVLPAIQFALMREEQSNEKDG
jgi:hypothetical protein